MNIFDDFSTVYLFPGEERIPKIKSLRPYIIFNKNNSFTIEELPLVLKGSIKNKYGEYYEVFYDSYGVSEYMLNKEKIGYVKTTVGEIKSQLDREIKEDIKYLRKDR